MDVSDIFHFFCSGEEKGESEALGGRFFIENPRRGGLPAGWGRGGAMGREGVCGEFGGGGLNIFLGGRNSHQAFVVRQIVSFEGWSCKHIFTELQHNPPSQYVLITRFLPQQHAWERNTKITFGLDPSQLGGGLPREGAGIQKLGGSLKPRDRRFQLESPKPQNN